MGQWVGKASNGLWSLTPLCLAGERSFVADLCLLMHAIRGAHTRKYWLSLERSMCAHG
jgi:hypothetical protein